MQVKGENRRKMTSNPSALRLGKTDDEHDGYSLKDIKEAKNDIKNGHTYTEATTGRRLCRATLHKHVHKDYPADMKLKRGPNFKFRTSQELDLVAYTNYCWERNVPRTQEMLKPDIAHYLYTQGLPNCFKHGEPGRGWFTNLKKHHADLKIPSQSTEKEYRSMPMSEREWFDDRDSLIRSVAGDKVLPTKQHIFIIEMQTICDARHPNIKFDVLIPYNAQADILLPFVIHNDLLGGNVKHYFRHCFAFTHSQDGHVDYEALYQCVQYIERYMTDQELPFPGIIYLQPELSDFFSFACWAWANQNGIIVCPLSQAVFNWLVPSQLGLLKHVMMKMHPYLLKPIYPATDDPANEHLLNAFLQVLNHGKLLGHISRTFQKLKILTVLRKKRQKRDILHELLNHTKHFRKTPYDRTAMARKK